MKAFSKCFAVVCAAASLLAVGGCSKNTPDNRVTTLANWNVKTATVVEKNELDYWQNHTEVATYSISFKEGTNSSYKVVYNASAEGTGYTTRFYMKAAYDWTDENIPEEYRSQEPDSEPVYVFETSLKLSGYYQIKPEGATKEFADETKTETYFRLAGDNLQPVYSHVILKNTAPAELNTTDIDSACVQIDEEYFTYYNKKCTQAISYKTDNLAKDATTTTRKFGLSGKDGYSVFDNAQIIAAVRSFNLSGGATRTFKSVSPQNNGVQTCYASVSSPVELKNDNTDHSPILTAIANCMAQNKGYIFFDGAPEETNTEESPKNMRYSAVTLSINSDKDMKGQSPTFWYSTVENNDLNSTRGVLLRKSEPMAFALGTVVYTLNSLNVEEITNN